MVYYTRDESYAIRNTIVDNMLDENVSNIFSTVLTNDGWKDLEDLCCLYTSDVENMVFIECNDAESIKLNQNCKTKVILFIKWFSIARTNLSQHKSTEEWIKLSKHDFYAFMAQSDATYVPADVSKLTLIVIKSEVNLEIIQEPTASLATLDGEMITLEHSNDLKSNISSSITQTSLVYDAIENLDDVMLDVSDDLSAISFLGSHVVKTSILESQEIVFYDSNVVVGSCTKKGVYLGSRYYITADSWSMTCYESMVKLMHESEKLKKNKENEEIILENKDGELFCSAHMDYFAEIGIDHSHKQPSSVYNLNNRLFYEFYHSSVDYGSPKLDKVIMDIVKNHSNDLDYVLDEWGDNDVLTMDHAFICGQNKQLSSNLAIGFNFYAILHTLLLWGVKFQDSIKKTIQDEGKEEMRFLCKMVGSVTPKASLYKFIVTY